jgi:NAD(P)-dependent dehydrogenase (short-subunit alcohol dehydrogenase family)
VDSLEGRVAVVTGAASGIGLALVETFLAEGAKVVMADFDAERLQVGSQRLLADGGEVLALETDVGDPAAVDRLARAASERFGRVDVLCNNAGTIAFGTVWEMTPQEWDRVMRVNLDGVVNGLRSFVPLMRASGDDGHIVNTASMAAFMKLGSVPPYVVSKHAVVGISHALAEDLEQAGSGIGVTVACPGMVSTRFGQPDADLPPEEDLPDGIVSARSAAQSIRQAMARRARYAFTHADSVNTVRERFDEVLGGFADR